MTPLKPFFTYFGGKYRIAPRYPWPQWATLIEPFAGSAGYAVRYPNRNVRLYEINPKVFGTWEYLINVSEKEIRGLPLIFNDVRDLAVCQEARWLIGWWLNKGHIQPCHIPGQWMRTGAPGFWGEKIRERIALQISSIRHWKVFNTSYEYILQDKATWFIDPPYQRSGRNYTFNQIDYEHLAEWVRRLSGQAIVCGQEGDIWLPFKPFVEARGTPGYKMPGTSKEMIWYQKR